MHYDELISTLSDEWVPIKVDKVLELNTVWLDPDFEGDKESFSKHFSYADPQTPCFSTAKFNQLDSIILLAERYGGRGIGYNGGGVRCGTLGKYQLKGIGTNSLVGNHDNKVHSYGGLDARSAINETIFTKVLEKVLPVGVAKVYGIIFTGSNTAIDPISQEECWGAILVREACVRPAHFLPAPGFLPRSEYRKSLRPDFARTKIVNQNLAAKFSSPNEYIMFLGKFLSKCANQMAFARIARIMHSTFSPSNMSIDGRWLDVPLSSFISGGENFGLSSNFYQEAGEPLGFCVELIHTYGKMNNLLLNPAPLISYYNEQLDAYCSHHLGYLFGLPFGKLNDQFKSDLNALKLLAMSVISKGKDVNRTWSEPDSEDPVVYLILGAFISLDDGAAAQEILEKAGLSGVNCKHFIEVFGRLTQALSMMHASSPRIFALRYGILALKRSVLAGMFYLSQVDKEVRELCKNGHPKNIEPLIRDYTAAAAWIFEDNGDEIVVFKSENYTFSSNRGTPEFTVRNNLNKEIKVFRGFSDAFMYFREIINIHDERFKEFSFKNYFEKLEVLSSHLSEQAKSRGANYAA